MQPAHAQLVASGTSLTVTTPDAVATFAGPDLVGFVNSLTNERYLTSPTLGSLASVNAIGSGGPLQSSNWVIATDPGTGQPTATVTAQAQGRSMTLGVRVDPVSREIVVSLSASVSTPGLRDASWSIAGLDMTSGRLIVPAHSGLVFDRAHSGVGTLIQYPNTWQAQMFVYESSRGSIVLYSTDVTYAFKQLRIGTRGDSSVDVAVATEAIAPYPSATIVPSVEWRLKAVAGDWRVAASTYRDWIVANRPPLSDSAHPWVSNIRSVVGIRVVDQNVLTPLAATVVPSQTLLYIHDWRRDAYDVNYPDYTPRAGVDTFVAAAKALGFKVMLHVDLIGISPTHPTYASLERYQVRTSESLERMGWRWEMPPSTPFRFAFINPASAEFRSVFIQSVRVAVNALQPDALHLDISAPMYNDGNGVIAGMTYPQASTLFHQELVAAFPGMVFGGEGENDILYRYHSFAQAWYFQADADGHPITTFLFSPKVQYYGHLGQPDAKEPAFREDLLRLQQRAVLPQLTVNSPADLDASHLDNARLIGIHTAWQAHAFTPAWSADWTGTLVRYHGPNGATAQFTDSGTMASLTAAGTTLFTIAHDVDRLTTGSFVASWPAFDTMTVYGLDRAKKYYLDAVARPNGTRVTSLPADVRLGAATLVGSAFAHIAILPQASTAFDFSQFVNAHIGVHYLGTDTPLGNGGVVFQSQITAAGVSRPGIFVHPPWQGQVGGDTFLEYTVTPSSTALLQFSVGVADDASCTDGVTFRVTADGTELWSRHLLRTGWHDGRVSLTAYAGRAIRLRLITHPGPAGNPGCDWALWNQLALTDLPTARLLDVPLALASGSVVSGLDGGGALSIVSSVSATVTNLPVPGAFTLFTQRGSDVFSGTNLASLPFDVMQAARDELARPGRVFGAGGVRVSATSGGVTKAPTVFAHPPTGGHTVLAWVVRLPANETLRIGWSAGLDDAAASDDGVEFSVRVNGALYWRKTATTHGWLSGTIDLARWRNQSILIELVTDSRGNPGWDWAHWADLAFNPSTTTCSYGFEGATSVAPAGGVFSVPITAGATCSWQAVSDVPWLTVSAASGIGDGFVMYTVWPNIGGTRSGTVRVAGQTYAVTQIAISLFTDDPVVPGVTPARAAHVTELRARIDAVRVRYGLPVFAWRDPTFAAGVMPIRAIHILDLRTAILQVYAALQRAAPAFTDPGLGSGTTIKGAHIQELRASVLAIE